MVRFAIVLSLVSSLLCVPQALAQAQRGGGKQGVTTEEKEAPKTFGPRKQVATIVLSGLAGAILGLSTLSFYGRPQEKLPNIAIGAAVGVIFGTVYTTYKAATQPREFYGTSLDGDRLFDKLAELELARGGPGNETSFQVFSTSFSF